MGIVTTEVSIGKIPAKNADFCMTKIKKTYLIEVEREFAEDSFSFHIDAEKKPTEEELLKYILESRSINLHDEGYRITISAVTPETEI